MPEGVTIAGRLTRRPADPPGPARSVEVLVRRLDDGALALRYLLAADMAAVAVPPRRAPARTDGLWRRTCFECFVAGAGEAYLEFNFSPSGEWAAYAFAAYRTRAPDPAPFDPRISVSLSANTLELAATIPAQRLPASVAALTLALAAVIEDASGGVAYWALRHAPGRPDFHHRDGFALTL